MVQEAEITYNELIGQISALSAEKDTVLQTQRIVETITEALRQLKEQIRKDGFADEQEEIQFYKHVKPKFHALYIYYASVFSVESDKPLGSKKAKTKYFKDELRRIDNFFYHNLELYKYYRSGSTLLDGEYFTRGQRFTGFMIDIVSHFIDEEVCTLASIKLSFLIAYQELREYFQNAMLEMDAPTKSTAFVPDDPEITWTDSKTDLVELAYSLHAARSLNNGKIDLNQVTQLLERSFHVNLGNTSRTFQEILERKKGYTSYLDKLKKELTKRMMEGD